MKNTVATFNASGKCMFEQNFTTAAKAHECYEEILESTSHFPKGYEITVVRYVNDKIMSLTTVTC